jgi:hypothetical protein
MRNAQGNDVDEISKQSRSIAFDRMIGILKEYK